MAEYQVVIVSPQGETWDVTERVSTLTWSGSIKRVSRSVEAVMATPNDGSLPELPCELGNELRLWCGGRTRFRGNIVTREKATEGVATTLTALDRGRFLANNEGWYTFRGAAPEEAVRALCGDFGIPVAALAATGTAVSRKYPGWPWTRLWTDSTPWPHGRMGGATSPASTAWGSWRWWKNQRPPPWSLRRGRTSRACG
ncbi:MAG: hypothetical protein ACLRIS_21195 [Flavonifractor plautii]